MSTKVLFIGNSFTYYNSMPCTLENIVHRNKENLEIDSITFGGLTFERYCNPEDFCGNYVRRALEEKSYDIVILQEQSTMPIRDYASFEKYGTVLASRARETGAKVFLLNTWAYGEGHDLFKEQNWTREYMTQALEQSYSELGSKLNAPVVYTGKTILKLSIEHPEINLYLQDIKHPCFEMSYLVALCLAKDIFDIDPMDVEYFPAGLTQKEAKTIRAYVAAR